MTPLEPIVYRRMSLAMLRNISISLDAGLRRGAGAASEVDDVSVLGASTGALCVVEGAAGVGAGVGAA